MNDVPVLPLEPQVVQTLRGVSTATLTTVLLKKGLRNVWMRGTRPLAAGPAAPRRPRLHAALRAGARGPRDAGVMGVADLDARRDRGDAGRRDRRRRCDGRRPTPASSATSCARAWRSAASPALVTDGVVRDLAGVLGTGLPVWCQGAAAPPSVAGLTFVGWQEPIGCGGVAVFPNDVIVADGDGAVVIPAGAARRGRRRGRRAGAPRGLDHERGRGRRRRCRASIRRTRRPRPATRHGSAAASDRPRRGRRRRVGASNPLTRVNLWRHHPRRRVKSRAKPLTMETTDSRASTRHVHRRPAMACPAGLAGRLARARARADLRLGACAGGRRGDR